MWKDKIKEIIYMLENSDVNEIEVRFWFKKIKVTKKPPVLNVCLLYTSPSPRDNRVSRMPSSA